MRPLYGFLITGKSLEAYLKLRENVESMPDDGHYIKLTDPIMVGYMEFVAGLPKIFHLELRKKDGIHLGTHRFLASATEFSTKHCEQMFHRDHDNEYIWIAELKKFYDNNREGLSNLDQTLLDWYPTDFGAVCVEGTIPDVTYRVYPLTKETMLEMVLACFEPCLPKSDRDEKDINAETSFWKHRQMKE